MARMRIDRYKVQAQLSATNGQMSGETLCALAGASRENACDAARARGYCQTEIASHSEMAGAKRISQHLFHLFRLAS